LRKVLFNCTTNIKGGASTNAANFIAASAVQGADIGYHYAVSPQVFHLIAQQEIDPARITLFDTSPSMSWRARSKLRSLEKTLRPDLVFTMAGPAYVKFRSTHLMGCSNPYIIFASLRDIKFGRDWLAFLARVVHTWYQNYYIRKADHYLFQSQSSMMAFRRRFSPKGNCYVVANAIGLREDQAQVSRRVGVLPSMKGAWKTVLCPFEDYPHKGYHILSELCRLFDRDGYRIRFVVTGRIRDTARRMGGDEDNRDGPHQSHIEHIGVVSYADMPALYSMCDIVFMPSVLEIFSSICVEALYFKKPLVLTDRAFNREVAGEYALYCNPELLEDCVAVLRSALNLADDDAFLDAGKSFVVAKYGKYEARYLQLVGVINSLLGNDQQ
jgi:glycosyltransferase involved in cell wall biosynthesis